MDKRWNVFCEDSRKNYNELIKDFFLTYLFIEIPLYKVFNENLCPHGEVMGDYCEYLVIDVMVWLRPCCVISDDEPFKRQGGVSVYLVSSPYEFSWGCKIVDDLLIVEGPQYNLCLKLDDIFSLLMRSCHLISNTNYTTWIRYVVCICKTVILQKLILGVCQV